MKYETERQWQSRVMSILELDYGHRVYEEVSWKSHHDRGRIDIIAETDPSWQHHRLFPTIGIECKVFGRQGMKWLRSAREQMRRYMNPENVYRKGEKVFDRPAIVLLATPESWHDGIMYEWHAILPGGEQVGPCCWRALTFFFQRVFLEEGCSILLNKKFQSNIEGGPIKNYYLGQ